MKDDDAKKAKKAAESAAKGAKKAAKKDAKKAAAKAPKKAAEPKGAKKGPKKGDKKPAKKAGKATPAKASGKSGRGELVTTPVSAGDSALSPGVKTFLEALRAQLVGERANGELFIKDAAKVRKALGEMGNAQWADNAKVLLDRALEDHNAYVKGQAKVVYLF